MYKLRTLFCLSLFLLSCNDNNSSNEMNSMFSKTISRIVTPNLYLFNKHKETPTTYKEFVRIIITDQQNRYLVMRTNYGDKFFWIFPGGKVKADESKDYTIKRELKQELNLSIPFYTYLGSSFTKPYKGENWKGYFYLAKNVSEETLRSIKNNEPEKCSQIEFFKLNDLYEKVTEEDSYVTKQILEEFFLDKV